MKAFDTNVATSYLAKSALLGALPEPDIIAIVSQMQQITFDPNQLIFSRGDRGQSVYLVLSGRVRLSILTIDGREISLAHASEGDVFGEIAALDGGGRSADATAISAVRALVLSQSALMASIGSNPRVAHAVIQFVCARLRKGAHRLEAIALHAIDVRLARLILSILEERTPGLNQSRYALSLGISQTEIGLLIGASRPKVNAAFAALESNGAIQRRGLEITCEITALRRCAAYLD